jgi:DNA-binding transcriptional ArsR family regulator
LTVRAGVESVEERTNLERRAKVFAALSDPTRLRIVDLLAREGRMTNSEASEKLGISAALYSHHGKILLEAGLATRKREGQRVYCSFNRNYLPLLREVWSIEE